MDAEKSHLDTQTLQAKWRAPRGWTADQKAAFREIVDSLPHLVTEDRLIVEVCAQLLARQKAGIAKPSESNRLLASLEKLRARAAKAAPVAAHSTPITSSSPSSSLSSRPSGEALTVNFAAYPHGFVVTGGTEFGGFWDRDEVRKNLVKEGRMTSEQYQNDDALELEELRQ